MTSRLGRFGVIDQLVLISALLLLPMLFPQMAVAQTDTKPLVLEIKNLLNNLNLTNRTDKPPVIDPIIINTAVLQDYLNQKGSPLAAYAQDILQHENWKLVLAISNGESTMCKRQMYNNCWGVGGAWNLRRYKSFSEGFADVNRLLGEKYIPMGADTPKKIVRKYVGNYSPTWVAAVTQVLNQIDSLPLVN